MMNAFATVSWEPDKRRCLFTNISGSLLPVVGTLEPVGDSDVAVLLDEKGEGVVRILSSDGEELLVTMKGDGTLEMKYTKPDVSDRRSPVRTPSTDSNFVFVDPPAWRSLVPEQGGTTPPWLAALLQRPEYSDPVKLPVDFLAGLGLLIRAWTPFVGEVAWGPMNETIHRDVSDWYNAQPESIREMVEERVESRLVNLLYYFDQTSTSSIEDFRKMNCRHLIRLRDELECLMCVVKNRAFQDELKRFDEMFSALIAEQASVLFNPFHDEPTHLLFQALHKMWPEAPWLKCYATNGIDNSVD